MRVPERASRHRSFEPQTLAVVQRCPRRDGFARRASSRDPAAVSRSRREEASGCAAVAHPRSAATDSCSVAVDLNAGSRAAGPLGAGRPGSRLRAGAASAPSRPPARRRSARPRGACPRFVFTCSTRAARAGRSHSSSGSRSETIERPPRSTKSAGLAAEEDDLRACHAGGPAARRFGQGSAAP